jgi:hypothetical protein
VPPWKRTLANKNEAVSFAAYRAAVDLFPGSKGSVFDPLMAAGSSPVDLRVRRTCISAEQVERPPL